MQCLLGVYLVLLQVLVLLPVCYANSSLIGGNYPIHKLENIPQNDVNYIFQDSRSFIWIGSLDGLHRFDGYTYKTYQTSSKANTINSNLISSIDEDNLGNIWVASFDKGICKLNPRTNEITDFSVQMRLPDSSSVYATGIMSIDINNTMWVAHKNDILRIEFDTLMERVYSINRLLTSSADAKAIFIDAKGQLWIGASHELIRIPNPYAETNQLTVDYYPVAGHALCELGDTIFALGEGLAVVTPGANELDSYTYETYESITGTRILLVDNSIWTGGRHGVCRYTCNVLGQWEKDMGFNGDFGALGLGSNVVFSMMHDAQSGVWVGTRGGGINRIDLNPRGFTHIKKSVDAGSLSNNLVRSVYQDSYGQLWIGTEEEGVSVARNPSCLTHGKVFKHLPINFNRQFDGVYAIAEMATPGSGNHESIIWLGTSYYTGLVGVNPHTLQVIRSNPELSQVGFAMALTVCDSMLWVGSYRGGLWRFIIDAGGNVVSYKQFLPGDYDGGVNSDIIRSLLYDSKNNLWIGTDQGIQRIDRDQLNEETPLFTDYTKRIANTRFGIEHILQIYEDSKARIWVGTMGSGLLCYKSKNSTEAVSFDMLTTDEGLPNNTIKSIVEDAGGQLWLGTNKGLSRLNPGNGTITNFDVSDGLQDNEFSEMSATRLDDGRLVFGGVNGINVFSPEAIVPEETDLSLYLTDISINNKQVLPGQNINGRVLLMNSIAFTESIRLKYLENSFSVAFVGIHYKSPQKIKYKYILEGFDDDWVNVSSQSRIAKYTNIPAGHYTFKVACSNSGNQMSTNTRVLSIHIKPPLYRSFWAFLIYVLLLTVTTYLLVQNRRHKTKERKKLLIAQMEKKRVEEMSKMHQQFFTNISHEFKTPLTLIKGPLEKLEKNPDLPEEDKRKSFRLIRQNIHIMMRLISQLMDFRKLDQNKLELIQIPVEVNCFVNQIYESFKLWAQQKSLGFTYTPSKAAIHTVFDKEKMELVLYNIISNAIKNTPEQGAVHVIVEEYKASSKFKIVVSDTGIGIPLQDQNQIFERFFQSNDIKRKAAGGTGIGLAHAKALVELHQGVISFQSNEGEGTTFWVEMPVLATRFEDNEVNTPEEATVLPKVEEEYGTFDSTYYSGVIPSELTVLIVEDNDDLRMFLKQELQSLFTVIVAADGVQGIHIAGKKNPDIILSDVMMPKMDGYELCKRIKEDEATSHIPVVLLTSKTSEEAQIAGFSSDADAYVGKPFSIEVLKHRIQALLSNRSRLKAQFHKELQINPMVISNTTADVNFMEAILGLIEEHLSDPGFNVDKLARAYGVSRVYLGKKIKALTGESPIQFQRTIRLKHAAVLLLRSDTSVSQVAWDVGYNDVNTFRIRFKEHFGTTPSEYRKMHFE